jgi:hypothetical protein
MTDGYYEAHLSLHMKEVIAKFWKAKSIFELEEDFAELNSLYELVRKSQTEWNEFKAKKLK